MSKDANRPTDWVPPRLVPSGTWTLNQIVRRLVSGDAWTDGERKEALAFLDAAIVAEGGAPPLPPPPVSPATSS